MQVFSAIVRSGLAVRPMPCPFGAGSSGSVDDGAGGRRADVVLRAGPDGQAGMARRRRSSAPLMPNPRIIMAQVAGSGTAPDSPPGSP